MNVRDLIPTKDQVEALQGIETEMLQRRRRGMLGFMIGVAGALAQVVLAIAEKPNLLTSIGKFFSGLSEFQWSNLLSPQAIGFYVIVLGFGIFFIYRKTSLLAKESKEPFQYTFWIEEFEDANGTDTGAEDERAKDESAKDESAKDANAKDESGKDKSAKDKSADYKLPRVRLHLLHHDLMERLNDRIRRFSLLDEKTSAPTLANARANSHIHISGHYAVRKAENGKAVLQVMPRIRIGPVGKPATLAHPVKFPIDEELDVTGYDQMVERVYSSIATEVYKQIEADVKDKLDVFPTHYLRAVALFHEAEDFARSNTLDAYDRAIELYKESRRTFNLMRVKWFSNLMARVPFFWRFKVKSQHLQAKIEIGYAKCLIYRRRVSAWTGRKTNPLYDIRESLGEVIRVLERIHRKMGAKGNTKSGAFMAYLTFPRDSLVRFLTRRPLQLLFGTQRQLLFEAYVVSALTHSYLGSVKQAAEDLERAKAVDPQISEKHALYLLTRAEIEPNLDKEIMLFRQATDLAPDFQIAQFLLAYCSQMRFRAQGELFKSRADSVLQEYAKVLDINPGNIAALAAQGYVWWLLNAPTESDKKKYLKEAEKKFSDGRDIKAIVADTFIGELNYGLARIAAELGRFNTSYDLFESAVTSAPAAPGLTAFEATSTGRPFTPYYDFISRSMVERYEACKDAVAKFINKDKPLDPKDGEVSERVKQAVYSFVLNDYGCACLNYYFRFGDRERLKTAVVSFKEASKQNPVNVGASYNFHVADIWQKSEGLSDTDDGKDVPSLEQVVDQVPSWQAAVISLIQSRTKASDVTQLRGSIESLKESISSEEEQARVEDQYVDDKSSGLLGRARSRLRTLRRRVRFRPAAQLEPKSSANLGLLTQDEPSKTAVALGAESTTEDETKTTQRKIQEAKTRSQRHKEQAKLLRGKLENAQKELQKLTQDTLARLARNTKLSPLEFDYTGNQVPQLLSNKKIKWDRLDEYDVEALQAWADAMANTQDRMALDASKRLVNHIITHYHPDSFDAHWILKKILDRMGSFAKDQKDNVVFRRRLQSFIDFARATIALGPLMEPAGNSTQVFQRPFERFINFARATVALGPLMRQTEGSTEVSDEVIKSALINWLKQDPINYTVLGLSDRLGDRQPSFVEDALKFESSDNYRANVVSLLRSQMNGYLRQKEYERALDEYRLAVKVAPKDPKISSELATAWQDFPELRVKALDTAITALRNGTAPPQQPDFQLTAEDLERTKSIGELFGEQAFDWNPQTIPILVTLYGDLRPNFIENQALTEATNGLTTKLLDEISTTMGIRVPPPRFRNGGGDSSAGSYEIGLHEIPTVLSDTFREGERMFPGSALELEVLRVFGRLTTNPRTGKEAVWISPEDQPKVESAGYKLWTIQEFVFADIEAVIRRNLGDFLGHQEVVKFLNQDGQPEVFKEISQDDDLTMELMAVLKRLLNEGVTITPIDQIVERFNTLKKAKQSLTGIVEEVRSLPVLLSRLPGNNNSYRYYRLATDFEVEIQKAFCNKDPHMVLAMEPYKYQQVLSAVRPYLSYQVDVALVVEESKLRPFVRKLLEGEFPQIPVLARRELRSGLASNILGEITALNGS